MMACPTECSALPVHLISRVIDHLEPNEKPLAGRLVSRDACKRLGQLSHRTARFSLPLPAHALAPAWQPHLQQALKQLTFARKLQSLPAAASSGSEVNLEVAWGLLRPCLFPELLSPPQAHGMPPFYGSWIFPGSDAGTAAVRSGHIHLLPWLVRRCCPLDPGFTLATAAEHCYLAGLQQVSELLACTTHPSNTSQWALWRKLATAAGRSGVAPTAKLSWLLSAAREGPRAGECEEEGQPREGQAREGPQDGDNEEEGHQQRLLAAAAAGAAESGSMAVLQWLQQQGMDLQDEGGPGICAPWWAVLVGALRHGHVAVADWLVDEAGCPLLQQGQHVAQAHMWDRVALGGSVEAMRWLLRRGAAAQECMVERAAMMGRLEAVQFLHLECGLQLTEDVFAEAAGSRSLPTVAWLLQAGGPMSPDAYTCAAEAGDVAMVRWLAQEAGCPFEQDLLHEYMWLWPRDRRSSGDLEQALRVLAGAGALQLPLSTSQCVDQAADRGDLPLLRYLHEECGVGFGPGTLAAAAEGGCEAVLEWLVGAGCAVEGGQGESDPYLAAGQGGDLATLSYLRHLGVPWGGRAYRAPVQGYQLQRGKVPLPVLRWLVERGARGAGVRECVRRAKEDGRFGDTVAWLEARLAAGPPAACKA